MRIILLALCLLFVTNVQANVCVCNGGTAATGADCTQDGANICTACNSGTLTNGSCVCAQGFDRLVTDGPCVTACVCRGGTPANDCTSTNQNKCVGCTATQWRDGDDTQCDCESSKGLHWAPGNRCAQNVCTCPGGTAKTGADCDADGAVRCSACEDGFTLDSQTCNCPAGQYIDDQGQCSMNVCTCENGTGATGTSCPVNGQAKCATCESGYQTNNDACVSTNTCTCSNGTAAVGAACTTATENCASCADGFTVNGSNQCVQNTCTCDNGNAATGADCTTEGAALCGSCNTGFHKNDSNACVANTCVCEAGDAVTGTDCTTDQANICASCTNGTLSNGSCVCSAGFSRRTVGGDCEATQCTCNGGTAATGVDCLVHESNTCTACTVDGLTLVGDQCTCADAGKTPDADGVCVQNVCTCDGGFPVTGNDCTVDGAAVCDTCLFGYVKVLQACVPNVCSCSSSNEAKYQVTGSGCAESNDDSCKGCPADYVLVVTDRERQCVNSLEGRTVEWSVRVQNEAAEDDANGVSCAKAMTETQTAVEGLMEPFGLATVEVVANTNCEKTDGATTYNTVCCMDISVDVWGIDFEAAEAVVEDATATGSRHAIDAALTALNAGWVLYGGDKDFVTVAEANVLEAGPTMKKVTQLVTYIANGTSTTTLNALSFKYPNREGVELVACQKVFLESAYDCQVSSVAVTQTEGDNPATNKVVLTFTAQMSENRGTTASTRVYTDDQIQDIHDALVAWDSRFNDFDASPTVAAPTDDEVEVLQGATNTGTIIGLILGIMAAIFVAGMVYSCMAGDEQLPEKEEAVGGSVVDTNHE